jgi:hypothetical protein
VVVLRHHDDSRRTKSRREQSKSKTKRRDSMEGVHFDFPAPLIIETFPVIRHGRQSNPTPQ